MPSSSPCVPCCDTPLSVAVPGPEGPNGTAGTNGVNAFSVTTDLVTNPGPGNQVQVFLDTTAWMVVGQIVVFAGPETYRVVSIGSSISATLEYLGYAGDLGGNSIIGTQVSPSGAQPALTTLAAIATGTPYDLLDTGFAFIDFQGGGSTDPSITLPDGTYLLFASARVGMTAATYGIAPVSTVGIQLQRTNNTPGTVKVYPGSTVNAVAYQSVPESTAVTDANVFEIVLCAVPYTTSAANDIVQLWANCSAIATPGDLQITAAQIIAVRIS